MYLHGRWWKRWRWHGRYRDDLLPASRAVVPFRVLVLRNGLLVLAPVHEDAEMRIPAMRISVVALVLLLISSFRSLPLRGAETPAQAEQETEVTVSLHIRGSAPQTISKPAKVTAIWFGKGQMAPVSSGALLAKPASLKLRPGRWLLQAEAPGFWGSPFQLELGQSAVQIALDLWPAGKIEGGFTLDKGDEPPSELAIFFRPTPEVPPSQAPPPAKVVCPVKERAWACPLPAGVMDLRLQAGGFVPRYLWDVRVEPGKTLRPGHVELRQGSAVLGWVVTADRSPIGENATVELRPRIAGAVPAKDRLENLSFKAAVNSRGFFQLEGVPPGAYVLEARHPRFATAVTSVRVVPGEVTEVANPPLLLDLPKALEVFVDPPVDPAGQSWSVKLQRLDRDSSIVTTLATEVASPDGVWRKQGLPQGRYLLRISRPEGDAWWMDEVVIDENPAPVQVRIHIVKVAGTVHLGKNPLAASLWFGGRHGAVRVEARSDEKGTFETWLPHAGSWMVHVSSESPVIEREIPKVEVQPKPGSDRAEVELRLPNTRLRGKVVDEAGKAITKAIITAQPNGAVQEGLVQTFADDEGKFALSGLPPGPALVQADAGRDRYAHPVEVAISEDREPDPIVLVARAQKRLTGTVVSTSGPVPGVRLRATPAGIPAILSASATTDARGDFELFLPPQTREILLTVSAPGFAFRMLRLPVPPEGGLTIGVEQVAGTLVIETVEPLDWTDPSGPGVYVLRDGAVAGLSSLRAWAMAAGVPPADRQRSVIPLIEPGEYQACLILPGERPGLDLGIVPPQRCVRGALTPNGELALKLPAVH